MSKKTAYEFIDQFFAIPEESGPVERKSYKRFKAAAAAEDVSEDTLRALFEAATGKTATYVPYRNVSPTVLRTYRHQAKAIVDAMDSKPTSVSDLAQRAGVTATIWSWRGSIPEAYENDSVRKCLRKMGETGIVGMLEVKTCGRCAIRLYNAI